MFNISRSSRDSKIMDNPYLVVSMLLILWGSFAAVSKLILNDLDSFQLQSYMFGSATIVMTIILVAKGNMRKLRDISIKEYIRLFLYAIPAFTYYFFYILALKLIPAVEASMLHYIFPVMIVVFSIPINGEKLDAMKVSSILLGLLGMIIIITKGDISNIKMSNIFGDFLALGAAISWGIFSNFGKKNKIDIHISNYIFMITNFLLSTISVIIFSGFTLPTPTGFVGVVWLGITNIVVCYYLWFKALKLTSTTLIASITFVTPFITLLFIVFFLGEKIYLIQILGLLVIFLGIALQNMIQLFKRKKV